MWEYQAVIDIPEYLIQGMSDDGLSYTVTEDGTVETDDPRIAINLSGGHKLLIDVGCRLIVTSKGITIEALVEVPDRTHEKVQL